MLNAVPSGAIGKLLLVLEARTGQRMASSRTWRIEAALQAVARDTGHDDLAALADAVHRQPDGKIADRVIDELLNQESSFFRDAAVFDLIAEAVRAIPGGRRSRIWSAGCSTGQEPLSLAMMFADAAGPAPEIVATDVSDAALRRARAGRYSPFEIQRGLPVRQMVRWFDQVDGDWVAHPELTRAIAFRRMNLVDDPLPIGRFDVILCRNVLFYFAPELRRAVLDRLAQVLRPDGVLVLGAGETVIGHSDTFRPSRRYRGLYEPNWSAAAVA